MGDEIYCQGVLEVLDHPPHLQAGFMKMTRLDRISPCPRRGKKRVNWSLVHTAILAHVCTLAPQNFNTLPRHSCSVDSEEYAIALVPIRLLRYQRKA